MRISAGPARKLARAWWPELLAGSLLTATGLAGQKDDPLFAVFVGIIVAIGWGMGRRHKLTPVHRKLDRLEGKADLIYAELVQDDQDEPDAPRGPHLSVVKS